MRGRRQPNWAKIIFISLICAIVVFVAAAFLIRRQYNQNLRPFSTSQKSQLFTVDEGASVQAVARDLQDAKLIRAAWAFEWYFRTHELREHLKAGTYSLRPDMSAREIADI